MKDEISKFGIREALQVGCEDEVYLAAAKYVDVRRGVLTEEERKSVFGCVRSSLCSAGLQVT